MRSAIADHRGDVDVFEQWPIACGEVGDVALEGEQMAFVFRCQRFERLAPLLPAGKRVDGVGATGGVSVVPVDDPPWSERFTNTVGGRLLVRVEHGAGDDHRRGQRRVRRPDDAVGDVGREFEPAGSEHAEPDGHLDRSGCGEAIGVEHANSCAVDDRRVAGEQRLGAR